MEWGYFYDGEKVAVLVEDLCLLLSAKQQPLLAIHLALTADKSTGTIDFYYTGFSFGPLRLPGECSAVICHHSRSADFFLLCVLLIPNSIFEIGHALAFSLAGSGPLVTLEWN